MSERRSGTKREVRDGEEPETYSPPSDPVLDWSGEVLGGFSESSMSSLDVARSSDGTLGDEAIEEAVRRELREDASTCDLDVMVVVRAGVARLFGTVPELIDAENAEEVAGRVPGVREVREELTILAG